MMALGLNGTERRLDLLLPSKWASTIALCTALVGCSSNDGQQAQADICSNVPGTACTWAGMKGERGYNGDGLLRSQSWLGFVSDLSFAADGRAWVVDYNNHRIRRVENDQTFSTVLGTDQEGDGSVGETDRLPVGNPAGALGTETLMNHPTDLDFLPDGNVVIAAWHNNKVRILNPNTGIVKVLSGDNYGYAGENVPAYQGVFNQPKSIVCDSNGQIYVVDQRNERIRLIDNANPRMIRTIGGTGIKGYGGDGGQAKEAQFAWDSAITPQPSGGLALRDEKLYVADSLNHRIRVIDLGTHIVTTIAGTGVKGNSGDGGNALDATLNDPLDIEFGPDDRLYFADTGNNAIRAIDLTTGIISHIAGNGKPCDSPINCYEDNENGAANDLQLSQPYGIAFDKAGNLYIADTNNSRIVKVTK